jgi:DNA-binding NtrC family response regulator
MGEQRTPASQKASERSVPERPILLVDDEPDIRLNLSAILRLNGYTNVVPCATTQAMFGALANEGAELVLLDLSMPPPSGREALPMLRERFPAVPVVIITGHNDLETAVSCMKQGAYDFLVKAIDETKLITTVRHALEKHELHREHDALRTRLMDRTLRHPEAFTEIVHADERMRSVLLYLDSVAESSQTILITGETGTGKDLLAAATHKASERTGQFVVVNVSGVDETMLADTLFGHVEGAYTGATGRREGLVAQAQGGTLFLDEIGDLPSSSQIKLLRLLENREYYPLGADTPRRSDARVIVATNRVLQEEMEAGLFRRDLYYRLLTHRVNIPPLRERPLDIPPLARHFLEAAAREYRKPVRELSDEALGRLKRAEFPGNARELRAVVFDAVSQSDGECLESADLSGELQPTDTQWDTRAETAGERAWVEVRGAFPTLREARDQLIDLALERSGGRQAMAARLLGISAAALSKELKKRGERSRA